MSISLDPMVQLPKDVGVQIFSHLTRQDLGRSARVSQRWKVLASDDIVWQGWIRRYIAFNKENWATYFGKDVGEEPSLPADIRKILFSPCPFWKNKKVYETHLLTLIPQTLDGEPLTLERLGEVVKSPKQGNPTSYRKLPKEGYPSVPVPKAHWVLMTRCLLPDSCSTTYAKQQALIANHASYQVPNVLDASVVSFTHYAKTKESLYVDWHDRPGNYTACQESYDAKNRWYVGGFSPEEGLLICTFNIEYLSNTGVAALRIL